MPLPVTTFAAVPLPLEPQGTPGHEFKTSDAFIVAGAALGVALVLVVWIVFFRKKPEHDYSMAKGEKRSSEPPPEKTGERRRRRKRRRVREHRPRNPTLDQTGGLPPPRPEDQPPPY